MVQCELCCERESVEIHPIHGPMCQKCKVLLTKHAADLVAFVETSPDGRTPAEIETWIKDGSIFEDKGD